MRALVVEDEIVIALNLGEGLRDAGFDVVVCHDAESALQWLSTAAPDTAVIDVGLPGMNGDELARHCRALHPYVPIVLATAVNTHELSTDFSGDQTIRILEKPFEVHALISCLQSFGVLEHSHPKKAAI